MRKYFLGFLKHLFSRNVSKLALVDINSYIGERARIYEFSKVFESRIGDYSYLNPHSWLVYAKVGKYCSIGHNSKVGLPKHTLSYLSSSPIFSEKVNATGYSWCNGTNVNPYKEVTVGNDVWIGERVIILGGLNIGNGAVVGAGAIVTHDVPPYAIVAGVPAKVIRYRFPQEVIDKLEEAKWWDLPDDVLKEHIDLFQKEDISLTDIEKFKMS